MTAQADDTMHLVVGWLGRSRFPGKTTRARAIADLIAVQRPIDFYSVRMVDEDLGTAIHCSFTSRADAVRVAACVKARLVYGRQWVFMLDQGACDAISLIIGESKRSRKSDGALPVPLGM